MRRVVLALIGCLSASADRAPAASPVLLEPRHLEASFCCRAGGVRRRLLLTTLQPGRQSRALFLAGAV